MSIFILVHGAWHGAWCWERVTPLLEARGHRAIAIDLPGMGEDRTPLASVTLELWARHVADLAMAQSEPAILVGHSRGGVVISQAAEMVPEATRGLIYVTAGLVENGRSLLETFDQAPNPDMAAALVFSDDGATFTLATEAVKPLFYQTTSGQWLARTQGRFTPEPIQPSSAPLSLSTDRFGGVPRAYIEASQDRAIPLALQRAMQMALPCDPVITLDTDHSPFFSAPDALVDALCAAREAFG